MRGSLRRVHTDSRRVHSVCGRRLQSGWRVHRCAASRCVVHRWLPLPEWLVPGRRMLRRRRRRGLRHVRPWQRCLYWLPVRMAHASRRQQLRREPVGDTHNRGVIHNLLKRYAHRHVFGCSGWCHSSRHCVWWLRICPSLIVQVLCRNDGRRDGARKWREYTLDTRLLHPHCSCRCRIGRYRAPKPCVKRARDLVHAAGNRHHV